MLRRKLKLSTNYILFYHAGCAQLIKVHSCDDACPAWDNAIAYARKSTPKWTFAVEQEKLHQIGFFGAGGVGKSALSIRLCQATWLVEYDPTIEDCATFRTEINDIVRAFEIVDHFIDYESGHLYTRLVASLCAYVLIFSIVERRSFEELNHYYDLVRQHFPSTTPGIVVGNKCDLQQYRAVSVQEAETWASARQLEYVEISARLDIRCAETILRLIQKLPRSQAHTQEKDRCFLS